MDPFDSPVSASGNARAAPRASSVSFHHEALQEEPGAGILACRGRGTSRRVRGLGETRPVAEDGRVPEKPTSRRRSLQQQVSHCGTGAPTPRSGPEGAAEILCTSPEPSPGTCTRWLAPPVPVVVELQQVRASCADPITSPPGFALRLASAMNVPAPRTFADRPRQRRKARYESLSVCLTLRENSIGELAVRAWARQRVDARVLAASRSRNGSDRSCRDSWLCASGRPLAAARFAPGLLHRGAEPLKRNRSDGRRAGVETHHGVGRGLVLRRGRPQAAVPRPRRERLGLPWPDIISNRLVGGDDPSGALHAADQHLDKRAHGTCTRRRCSGRSCTQRWWALADISNRALGRRGRVASGDPKAGVHVP